jgi:hypothetical protein
MKVARVLLFVFFGLSVTVAFAQRQLEPCAPISHLNNSLHIAWIDCKMSDVSGNKDEVVIIVNGTNGEINLKDYTISDESQLPFKIEPIGKNIECCMIEPHDIIRIHSGNSNKDASPVSGGRDLYWLNSDGTPRIEGVWNDDHDRAELKDKDSNVVDIYEYRNGP